MSTVEETSLSGGTGDNEGEDAAKKEEPKLRHEFVALMFALATAEVGLQVSNLIAQPGKWYHLLPAYSHLMVAVIVIATSWVGWTRSQSPGGRKDVTEVLQSEFVVLLLDVACVVCYFVLTKQVDFTSENGRASYRPSAAPEAWWILTIFGLYLVWDIWTKIIVPLAEWLFGQGPGKRQRENLTWFRAYGVRFAPTVICLLLSYLAWSSLDHRLNVAQVVIGDAALLMLVLLFRALKDCTSVLWPKGPHPTNFKFWRTISVALLILLTFMGLLFCAVVRPNDRLRTLIGVPENVVVGQTE
jgi:hypothetical protein